MKLLLMINRLGVFTIYTSSVNCARRILRFLVEENDDNEDESHGLAYCRRHPVVMDSLLSLTHN